MFLKETEDDMEECEDVLPEDRMNDMELSKYGQSAMEGTLYGCIMEAHVFQCIRGMHCRAYCPGGTSAPIAKRYFYWAGYSRSGRLQGLISNGPTKGSGAEKLMSQLETCSPPDACLGENKCKHGYGAEVCTDCIFKYFRQDNRCWPCGLIQVIGSLAATGICTFAIVGVLIGVMVFMKFKADLKFRTVLISVIKTRIIKPIQVYGATTRWGKAKVGYISKICTESLLCSYVQGGGL